MVTELTCAARPEQGDWSFAVRPLPHSRAPWRGELLRYRTSHVLARLAARFNANVNPDGTIRLP
jgi:hypothetical protein